MVEGGALVCLLSMLALAYGCGKVPLDDPLESRVVGGHAGTDGNWPFTASVCGTGACCSGSIIAEKYVLTAAHCVDDEMFPTPEEIKPSHFYVLVGTVNRKMEPLRLPVKRIVTGRHWSRTSWPRSWADDVALVELTNAIEFDDYAQPICLPKSFRERHGDIAYFVGWGAQNRDADPWNYTTDYDRWPDVANENIVTFRKWSECRKDSWLHSENYICAGQHMRLVHHGDSGGPLMVNRRGTWIQVGIFSTFWTSEGRGKAGFERVTSQCRWIEKKTNGTVRCIRN